MKERKNILIRLATPETCGSGFYLNQFDIIITAEHIIRGFDKVIIENNETPRQLAEVLYTDPILDISFLKTIQPLNITDIPIASEFGIGDKVISKSAPFGMAYREKTGTIEDDHFMFHDIAHIRHTGILGNECNGGPLFSERNELLGMNHFIRKKSATLGLTLPIHLILDSVKKYQDLGTKFGTRCTQCTKLVGGDHVDNCIHCGAFISMPYKTTPFEVEGVGKTIENLLVSMGYTLSLSRIGPKHWEIIHGSAAINITYYEKNGLIIGDAYLCKLPQGSNKALFEYLLRQNQEMENLTFSIKDDDIILSLLIYDRYLNQQTGTELLSNLLDKADFYDNILVGEYKCLWVSSSMLV